MAYVDKINVQGTDYDIRDKRIAGTEDVNVKPIYFHGIELYDDTNLTSCTVIILNNSPTKFTIPSLKQWALSLDGNVMIACNGNVYLNGTYYEIYGIMKTSSNTFDVFVLNTSFNKARIANVNFDTLYEGLNDNVNKIN